MKTKKKCEICGKEGHLHKVDGESMLCCKCTDGVLRTRSKYLWKLKRVLRGLVDGGM